MKVKIDIPHSASHLVTADFDYVQGIVDRNFISQGPLCAGLEQRLAALFDCKAVALTDSGTAALHLALLALREHHPAKTKVLVGAYVCPEVIGAVIRAGLKPVLADCCRDSLNVDMDAAGRLIDDGILAVICTNIGGMPDDYAAASRFGVPIISDCAQAIGSCISGQDVASAGHFTILSFGATKMVSAGGGGAILCRSEQLAQTIAELVKQELPVEQYRKCGFRVTYGQHFGDLTAGLVVAQLGRLEAMISRRRMLADSYDQVLRERADVPVVEEAHFVRSNRFRYYFLSDSAQIWVDHLRDLGVDARRSISHVIPEYYGTLGAFPVLDRVSNKVVSVPIFPAMSDEQSKRIIGALESCPTTN